MSVIRPLTILIYSRQCLPLQMMPYLSWCSASTCRSSSSSSPAHLPDFNDTKSAFKAKTTRELIRAYVVYKMFSYSSLVDRSEKLIKLSKRIFGTRIFNRLMRTTVYGQFVAGEDLEEIRPVMERFKEHGIRSILDYAVEDDVHNKEEVSMETRQKEKSQDLQKVLPTDQELHPQFSSSKTSGDAVLRASARTYFYEDEHKCDKNMEDFIKCINVAADASNDDDAFAAIKLTGLGRTQFLLRLSESLVGSERVFKLLADKPSLLEGKINADSFLRGIERMKVVLDSGETEQVFNELDIHSTGSIGVFHWLKSFKPNTRLYQLLTKQKSSKQQPLLPVMSDNEKDQMTSVIRRVETLAQCAQDRGVRLMVDAEQTYYQPAIRYITVDILMSKYNLSSPVIYNTQQCYLKATENSICLDLLAADVNKFHYGVKLVRGAYMEQERHLAIEKGYEDPIWSTKTETDNNYYKLLEILLSRVRNGRVNIMVATHNEDTIKFAVDKVTQLGIDKTAGSVVFGQLLGMCDHVTFSLGSTGYLAYKYMPYGPVEEVLSYLIRRANENKGMLDGAVRERKLLTKELKRRAGLSR